MIVTNGTKELIDMYYGEPQMDTIRSIVVLDEGRPVGIAGLKLNGTSMLAFTEISDELRNHKSFKRIMVKAYRKWLEILPDTLPIFAICNPKIEGADKLLKHAGFEYFGDDLWQL